MTTPNQTKYRPSNGTEGEIFFDNWCRQCARDKAMSEGWDYDECEESQICTIVWRTSAFHLDEPEYPIEWILDENDTPKCTAFIKTGETVPFKDDLTVDMFEVMK